MASHNPQQIVTASGGQRLTTPGHSFCKFDLRATLGALLVLVLIFISGDAQAQSGRNKQPTKPSTSPTGTTRSKRVSPSSETQPQTPPQTTASPIRLPSGTVIMDEAPPAPPVPKPTPTPTPDTSEGDEVGVEDVVRITSNLVTVPASVVDSQGRAIIDLKLEDFELRVDGQPRPISEINFSDTPVRIVMLFDNSMSMSAGRDFEKQAAVKFFRHVMRPQDYVAVYSIYTYPVLAQPFTNNVPALVRTIERFPKPEDGTTSLFDTVAEAAAYLRPYPERKVIVIVSDGADTTSNLDFDKALRRAQAADCQIYAIQTGQYQDNANLYDLAAQTRLRTFAEHTGGALYIPRATSDLDYAFTQITADLSQQYILSYYPNDDRSDGRFRIISVRVASRSNMRVRARRGYYPRRPNERISYNVQTPGSIEPLTNQSIAATPTDSFQTDSPKTESLSSRASVGTQARISGSVPARSKRVGPSEPGDESDTNASVLAAVNVEEPVVKSDKVTVKESQLASPPPKAGPEPTPPVSNDKTQATTSVPSVSDTTTRPAKPVSGGVLNGRAISLPKPQYPLPAKKARASGVVTVEVLLDESGKVISARALDGNPYLRVAAVDAARQARFSPTVVSGKPVTVTGVITYKFTLIE